MKKATSEASRTPEFANTIAENFYWLKKYAEADGCWPPEAERLPVDLADTTSRIRKVGNGFIITDDRGKEYVEHEGAKMAENLKQILLGKIRNMEPGESIDVRLVIYGEERNKIVPNFDLVGACAAIRRGALDFINEVKLPELPRELKRGFCEPIR